MTEENGTVGKPSVAKRSAALLNGARPRPTTSWSVEPTQIGGKQNAAAASAEQAQTAAVAIAAATSDGLHSDPSRRVRRLKNPSASTLPMTVQLTGRLVTPHQSTTVAPMVSGLTVSISTLHNRPVNSCGAIR